VYCPECNTELPGGSRYCHNCGTAVTSSVVHILPHLLGIVRAAGRILEVLAIPLGLIAASALWQVADNALWYCVETPLWHLVDYATCWDILGSMKWLTPIAGILVVGVILAISRRMGG
jgi:hypothetical protein